MVGSNTSHVVGVVTVSIRNVMAQRMSNLIQSVAERSRQEDQHG